jgi:hypothetical protein
MHVRLVPSLAEIIWDPVFETQCSGIWMAGIRASKLGSKKSGNDSRLRFDVLITRCGVER